MTTYRQAGVDIEAGNEFVRRIAPLVRSTFRPEVLTDLGGFGGLFRFQADRYTDPVLVSGTDGVGTKLKIAFLMDRHDTVGVDLVAMCVNDVAVSGAEPLFFLDYLATGKLSVSKAEAIVRGIAEGCRQAGCALIGGETAEMPSFYAEGEYDLAGFAVGVVDRPKLIDGRDIVPGDVLVGLASSGLHSNGYSLVRRVLLEECGLKMDSRLPELAQPLGETLLTPTRIYAKQILALAREFSIKGVAHITGGGITENLPRVLPKGCRAKIRRGAWPVPAIFGVIQERGRVDQDEMYRVFNMGIGLILIVPPSVVEGVIARAVELGDRAYRIGEIVASGSEDQQVEYVG
ncbi:MAG: phosphoribosylformylglycinamidine cyclo-ligase [Nitrospiraceae bacterium]|nr:MAG: phosphoribosylformylglycinamidine cyclo-ligase [Nitrospiraceae bacterium]